MRRQLPATLTLAAALLVGAAAAAAQPTLSWREAPGKPGRLELCALPVEPGPALAAAADAFVRIAIVEGEAPAPADLPRLWGRWTALQGCLVFVPRHRPAAGMTLVADFDGTAFDRHIPPPRPSTPKLQLRHAFPRSAPAARVVEVAPSGETIPDNLLRFYVTFDRPMSLRDVERHVSFEDAAGRPIADALVAVPEGLWNPQRTRLTLFLQPGRVKSGIGVGEALGKALEAGAEVALVVGPGARDADGATLAEGFRKTWRVGAAEKRALDPALFCVDAPAPGRGGVRLGFGRPLDRELLRGELVVRDAAGANVAGRLEVEPGDAAVVFHPAAPWQAGQRYRWVVGDALEDAAGNRLGLPFERPVGQEAAAVLRELPFEAGAAAGCPR